MMREKTKLKKVAKLYDEICDLFPKGSVSMNIHDIKEKDIPKEYSFKRNIRTCDAKVYKRNNKNNKNFNLVLFVNKEDQCS
jgi:hypothetical protein